MIYLDTSFLIRSLIPGSLQDTQLRSWLKEGVPLHVSAVVWAEYRCGADGEQLSLDVANLLAEVTPFGELEAEATARLYNSTGRLRGSFPDCMIAATAIIAGAPLATLNVRDFMPFSDFGLQLAG